MSRKVAIIGAIVSLLLVCTIWFMVNSIKERKAEEVYNFQQTYVTDFANTFINFHNGDEKALDSYIGVKDVDVYRDQVLKNETTKIDLLALAIEEREVPENIEFGQSPPVVEDEDFPSTDSYEEVINLPEYLLELGYDESIVNIKRGTNGELLNAYFDPTRLDIRTELIDVLFAGSHRYIERKDITFAYKDMVKQTMYNSLKIVDSGRLHDDVWFVKLQSLTDTSFTIGFKFEDVTCTKITIRELK